VIKAAQFVGPELGRLAGVSLLQPRDVIVVRRSFRKFYLAVFRNSLITEQYLLKYERQAPPIQKNMMMTPDQRHPVAGGVK